MTSLGSLDRWIEGSQTPKGHKHEIQHALGQGPGQNFQGLLYQKHSTKPLGELTFLSYWSSPEVQKPECDPQA